MAKKDENLRFDSQRLQNMSEPLTIRVEKLRGSVRQPIELPPKGDDRTGWQPPGVGWSREEVLQLENFILTQWSGGGYYEFAVTDAKGDVMRWQSVWDPRQYPEKLPPNTAAASLPGAATPISGPAPVPAASQPFGVANAPQLTFATTSNNPPHTGPIMSNPPTPLISQTPLAVQQPQQAQPGFNFGAFGVGAYPGQPMYPMAYPPPYQPPQMGYQTQLPSREDDRRRRDDEERAARERHAIEQRENERVRALEEKIRVSEMERKDLEHKQAIERQQQLHEASMLALREEMRRLGESRGKGEDDEIRRLREEAQRAREESIREQAAMQTKMMEQQLQIMRDQFAQAQANAQPKGENEELRRLREDAEKARQEQERYRQEQDRRLADERALREREKERSEQQRRDEMMQREAREHREAMERRLEAALTATNNANPVVEALKENARANAENMREIARMTQQSTDRMAQFMVPPVQLAQMMRETSSGSDGVMRNMVETMSGVGKLYRDAAEAVMGMQGGPDTGSATARIVEQTISRASEVADRFLAVKRDQVIGDAKVKTAQANAEQTRFAAEAQVRTAAMQQQQRAWAPPPPVAQNGAAQNGAANGHAPTNGHAAHGHARPAHGAPLNGAAGHAPTPAPKTVGPLELPPQDNVEPKRTTAPSEAEFFGEAYGPILKLRESVVANEFTPDKTVNAILQGVNYVIANNKLNSVPAFVLFVQERWADFVDVLLPAPIPQEFRNEVVSILIKEVSNAPPSPDEGDPSSHDDASTAS